MGMLNEELREPKPGQQVLQRNENEEIFSEKYMDKVNIALKGDNLIIDKNGRNNVKSIVDGTLKNERQEKLEIYRPLINKMFRDNGCSRQDVEKIIDGYKKDKHFISETELKEIMSRNAFLTMNALNTVKEIFAEELRKTGKYDKLDEKEREKELSNESGLWILTATRVYYKDYIDKKYEVKDKGNWHFEKAGTIYEGVTKSRAKFAVEMDCARKDFKYSARPEKLIDRLSLGFAKTMYEVYPYLEKFSKMGTNTVLQTIDTIIQEKLERVVQNKLYKTVKKTGNLPEERGTTGHKADDVRIYGNLQNDITGLYGTLFKQGFKSADISHLVRDDYLEQNNFKELNALVGAILAEHSFMNEILEAEHEKKIIPDEELIKLDAISRQAVAMTRGCYSKDQTVMEYRIRSLQSAVNTNPEVRSNNTIGGNREENLVKELKEIENTIKTIEAYENREKNGLDENKIKELEDYMLRLKISVFEERLNNFSEQFVFGGYDAIKGLMGITKDLAIPVIGVGLVPMKMIRSLMTSRFFTKVDQEWDDILDIIDSVCFAENEIF